MRRCVSALRSQLEELGALTVEVNHPVIKHHDALKRSLQFSCVVGRYHECLAGICNALVDLGDCLLIQRIKCGARFVQEKNLRTPSSVRLR